MSDATYALTVRQPWADLIVAGVKDVENRSWRPPSTLPEWTYCGWCGDRYATSEQQTEHDENCGGGSPDLRRPVGPFPFTIAIHAAAQPESMLVTGRVMSSLSRGQFAATELLPGEPWDRLGVIVGTVTVTGCHHADDCGHICPEAGCDDCADPLGACGHGGAWPAIDATGEAIPCDVRRGEVCNNHCSRWAEPDRWHWTLTDAQPLDEPVPAKGRLGLWKLAEVPS